jgi:tellurite resistance protein TerC
MSTQKALKRLLFWVGMALLFNAGIYFFEGPQKAMEFMGGYIIEQSLSLDNLFLFILIFTSFGIESKYQGRVLNYGIFGAIVLRLIFVVLGVTIVNKFHWMLYVFGLILIVSGIKMFVSDEESKDVKDSKLIGIVGRIIPVTKELHGEKFFIRINNILYATPLFAIIVLIEGSDILFAIDSIPAIFSITRDPFIVYTSNIFAILGLRNMYFLLEKLHNSFRFVKYGVAAILTFTGVKLSVLFFHFEISLPISLLTIFSLLAISILASIFIKEKPEKDSEYSVSAE